MIRKSKVFIILTVLSIPALIGLIRSGFYEPHDTHHLADIYEMWRAITSGQLPPRLGPDFLFGYGYPLFNFYYLLPFYLGSFFYQLTGSLTVSLKMVFVVSCLISVYGMYLFLREFVGKYPAVAGSLLFLYTPYRAVQIYVRGAVGEALALAILPWVLLFVVRLLREPSKKTIGALSLTIFLFIISHNYFFALSMPFIYLFALLLKNNLSFLKRIFLLTISNLISVLMAAYWLGPAILEKKFVRTETPFPLIDHFPFIRQLILPSWGYGSSVWGPTDEISFQIGSVNICVFVLALIITTLYRKKIGKLKYIKIFLWSMFGFVISVVFMNVRTYSVWKELPFHNLIQFPWRLLVFTTFFSSVLSALLLDNTKLKKSLQLTSLFILFTIAITVPYFKGSHYVNTKDEDYLNRFFNDKNYSEDYLLLPLWVESRSDGRENLVFESNESIVSDKIEISPVHYVAETNSDREAYIVVNKTFYPGWEIFVDGRKKLAIPFGNHGEFGFLVSDGIHRIELVWNETPVRKMFNVISLFSFFFCIYLFFPTKVNLKITKK